MDIIQFIQGFKEQLEDENTTIVAETDYVNSDFWDSLTNMVINVMLEDNYKIKLTPEELNKFSSIQELFNYVETNSK